jgi:hypothetical protein
MKRTFSQSNSTEPATQTSAYELLDNDMIQQVTAAVSKSVIEQLLTLQKMKTGELDVHVQSNQMLTPVSSHSNQMITSSLLESEETVLIGSGSRTSSNSSTSFNTTNTQHQSISNILKLPKSHRHFLAEPRSWTFSQFQSRLQAQLPDAVMESELLKKFPTFHEFRIKYINPLKVKFPDQKLIELTHTDHDFCSEFLESYRIVFKLGCHVLRGTRQPGVKAIPDTKERIMYRILIKDLWELLGKCKIDRA